MPSDLTLGAEYNYDGLEDEVIGYERYMKQKVRIAGTYLQNEWKNERWSLLVGGRLDKHNLVDHVIFSPRANLRFNPNRSINLRASYAGGFRAPQAFDEDLHVSLVGGERLVTRLADNLKEERSNSFSVSADPVSYLRECADKSFDRRLLYGFKRCLLYPQTSAAGCSRK